MSDQKRITLTQPGSELKIVKPLYNALALQWSGDRSHGQLQSLTRLGLRRETLLFKDQTLILPGGAECTPGDWLVQVVTDGPVTVVPHKLFSACYQEV